jgi:hypothetical protein
MKANRIHSVIKNPNKCWVCNYTLSKIQRSRDNYLNCTNCGGFYLIRFFDKDGDRQIIVLADKFDKIINSSYNVMILSNLYKTFTIYITYNTPDDSINIGTDKDFDPISFRKLNLKDYINNIIQKHRKNLIFT